jgi:hypothetical protein
MDRDDLWIVEHFSELVTKYAGKYVAVVNEQLVAVGDSRRDVEAKAREVEPEKIPSVLRVPREEDMVCLLRVPVYAAQRLPDADHPDHDPESQSLGLCRFASHLQHD